MEATKLGLINIETNQDDIEVQLKNQLLLAE